MSSTHVALDTPLAEAAGAGAAGETRVGADGRDEILAAVRRIGESSGFDATDRSRKLLEYIVNEVLSGRGARIKAYSIATEVLGRPESFDPQKDPIVRIEAARLRRALEHYYLTDGRTDPMVIAIPKGAYVPIFERRRPAEDGLPAESADPRPNARATAITTTLPGRRPLAVAAALALFTLFGTAAILAGWLKLGEIAAPPDAPMAGVVFKPLLDLTGSKDSATMVAGLSERIIEKTSRFKDLSVIAGDASASAPLSVARYEFGGTARMTNEEFIVQTRLVDRTDGRVMWADSITADMKVRQLYKAEVEIANKIATVIGEPDGVVFDAERRQALDTPPENWSAYVCTLQAYAYRATFSSVEYGPVRNCLEKAVKDSPGFATAWALLSLVYIDEARFFYASADSDANPTLATAFEAARRAIDLDPANVRGQQAMMMALFFQKKYAEALRVGGNALSINPNDIELKGDFGYRLALSGEWERGCALVQDALNASARKIAYYKTALAVCSYIKNDLQTAAALIADAAAFETPAYHVIAAAILAQAGDLEGADDNRRWLEQNARDELPRLLQQLPLRMVRPEDSNRFRESLRKAGFDLTG